MVFPTILVRTFSQFTSGVVPQGLAQLSGGLLKCLEHHRAHIPFGAIGQRERCIVRIMQGPYLYIFVQRLMRELGLNR